MGKKWRPYFSYGSQQSFIYAFTVSPYDILKILKAMVKSVNRISYYTIFGGHVEIIRYTWVWTFCFHSRDEYFTVI